MILTALMWTPVPLVLCWNIYNIFVKECAIMTIQFVGSIFFTSLQNNRTHVVWLRSTILDIHDDDNDNNNYPYITDSYNIYDKIIIVITFKSTERVDRFGYVGGQASTEYHIEQYRNWADQRWQKEAIQQFRAFVSSWTHRACRRRRLWPDQISNGKVPALSSHLQQGQNSNHLNSISQSTSGIIQK